jgi:predicted nicotinamide N-methyase
MIFRFDPTLSRRWMIPFIISREAWEGDISFYDFVLVSFGKMKQNVAPISGLFSAQIFPLWAKIWQASWVLAGYLADKPVAEEERFLEIGGGTGLVSIVATCFGHHITMAEYNPDALQFARANAIVNGCPQLSIRELDWHHPRLPKKFDYIVASEISYRKEDIQPLMMLFESSLKPGGEVILAGVMRKLSKEVYKALEQMFDIRVLKKILRSDNEKINIFLFRMTLKHSR